MDKLNSYMDKFRVWFDDKFHNDSHRNYRFRDDMYEFLTLSSALPKDLVEELGSMYHKEMEEFLSGHYEFAKKYKELEHKADMLNLDIKEHMHKNGTAYDKKVLSESLADFKKLKDEMGAMLQKEKDRAYKMESALDDKVHKRIQDFLKK